MKILLTLLLIVLTIRGHCQTFSAKSNTHGIIKTKTGKLTGTLDIDHESDRVMWHHNDMTKILGASQIVKVTLMVNDTVERVYYGRKVNGEHYLFEALSLGKTTILYREKVIKDQYNKTYYDPFFISKNNKELVPILSKKEMLAVFGGDSKWMNQYIKSLKLDMKKRSDVKQALDYYTDSSYEFGG